MQSLSEELISKWNGGTVILSPVNIIPEKLLAFTKQIHNANGDVLFDPQMFYPKEGHFRLKEYDYWPQDGVSISDDNSSQTICRELLKINNSINSKAIILPGTEINEGQFEYALARMRVFAEYLSSKTDKPLYATLRKPDMKPFCPKSCGKLFTGIYCI